MEVLHDILSQLRSHERGKLNLLFLDRNRKDAPQICVCCVSTVVGNFHFTFPSKKERATR